MAQSHQQAPVGHTSVRALTLKQLKDMIEEIYASKTKYDQKYAEAKLPRETMEQHMYTYLNQKYGLKVYLQYNTFNTHLNHLRT